MNDLATLLESAGYTRNSRKEFLIPTKYKRPTNSVGSVMDFSEFDSDDSEGINDILEALNK
jgi:hypothetical protein